MTGFDFNVIWSSLPFLWQGLQLSLLLTVLAIVGGIVLGGCTYVWGSPSAPNVQTPLTTSSSSSSS